MRFSHQPDPQPPILRQNNPHGPVYNISSGFQSIDDEMDSLIDLSDPSKALDLSRIRYQLIRLEDTITFHLIERAQFALNKTIYYPFFPEALQKQILKPLHYPRILHPNDVNVNDKIKKFYVDTFLPALCPDFGREDRGEIHFGKFVAESKFQSDPEKYTALIKAEDRDGIGAAITNAAVEKKVLERLRLKCLTYGTDPSIGAGPENQAKIDADSVVALYKDFVIPLTKEVEVEYLMQRLEPVE
uniref:chorismate mutase n=1 Tax=Colletotrichum fructicola (strain Nara gc5) TaxID=1213859 RepID=L2FDI0_COLFN